MQLILSNIGKRFNREWVFRHFSYEFSAGKKYAVTGSNGSGKSTLLQVIAGSLSFNEGEINVYKEQVKITTDSFYKYVSIAAPYLELVEEMTALEFLNFHHRFKPLSISISEILQQVQLDKAANKQVRYFSSGMKQRLKLAQAFFCNSPVLLLDEPLTNLDADGITLYYHLIEKYSKEKLVVISSNDEQEYSFCDAVIVMGDYK
jgi:ABC-type multidrug transport system ATPase subunit